jgi:replicative DNA helicase
MALTAAEEARLAELWAQFDATHPSSTFVKLDEGKLGELLTLKQQPIDAVPTNLPAWNHRCRDFGGGVGLARGWHVTLAANPGAGKSVQALNMAAHATKHGESVGFVSLEMPWEQLATRYMAIQSGENIKYLEPGSGLNASVHKQAARSLSRIEEQTGGKLWCNEREMWDLKDIEDSILSLFDRSGCRVIIVDYMQLVEVSGTRDRNEAVTLISHSVRRIGKRLKIVTIGLSQFNRETAKDYEHPPTPQGLMGGSPLENDSDQVMMIDHSSYARNGITNTAKQNLILGKNRHGPVGTIECEWNYDTLRLTEVDNRGEAWEETNGRNG